MKFMVEVLDHDWQRIFGTSVGALNGAGMCMFPVGQAKEGLDNLLDIWSQVTDNQIYKHWWPGGTMGDLIGVLWKDAVYNTSPVRRFVEKHFDRDKLRASGRSLEVSVYNLDIGRLEFVDGEDDDILLGILASSSYPMFFQPVPMRDHRYSDGGVVEIVPLKQALKYEPAVIDVIICQPDSEEPWDSTDRSTLETMPRLLSGMTTEIANNDVIACAKDYPGVTIRVWRPDRVVGSGLDFAQDKVQRLIKEGYEYAEKRAVALGLMDVANWEPRDA